MFLIIGVIFFIMKWIKEYVILFKLIIVYYLVNFLFYYLNFNCFFMWVMFIKQHSVKLLLMDYAQHQTIHAFV